MIFFLIRYILFVFSFIPPFFLSFISGHFILPLVFSSFYFFSFICLWLFLLLSFSPSRFFVSLKVTEAYFTWVWSPFILKCTVHSSFHYPLLLRPFFSFLSFFLSSFLMHPYARATDLRAFGCSLCDKAFKQKQHLDRHLQCHSGELPAVVHFFKPVSGSHPFLQNKTQPPVPPHWKGPKTLQKMFGYRGEKSPIGKWGGYPFWK